MLREQLHRVSIQRPRSDARPESFRHLPVPHAPRSSATTSENEQHPATTRIRKPPRLLQNRNVRLERSKLRRLYPAGIVRSSTVEEAAVANRARLEPGPSATRLPRRVR